MADTTYFASVLASVAGANKRHLVIWNGHASVLVRVYSIQAAGAPTAAVTGLVIPLYAARIDSAPTGGSAGSWVKADTGNPAVPASITITLAATGGANEIGAFGCGVVSGEETGAAFAGLVFDSPLDGSQPFILRQNEGLVVKQGALASAGAVTIVVKVGSA